MDRLRAKNVIAGKTLGKLLKNFHRIDILNLVGDFGNSLKKSGTFMSYKLPTIKLNKAWQQ